jgi:predicted dehydrogenase
MNRRSFIKRSIAAGSLLSFPTIIPSNVLARNGNPGANDRIVTAVIGTGNMGSGHVRNFSGRSTIAAIADAYLPHAHRSVKWLHENERVAPGHTVDVYQDYRRVLERDDIDAVIIATPEHWHVLQGIHAAQAGKHIYCEKPVSQSIWQGRQLVKAVEKYNVVFQTGSQQRSSIVSHRGITHLRNGTIGKINRVTVHDYTSPQHIDWPAQPIHEGLDWDLWCGPAIKPDFNHAIWSNKGDVAPCWSGVIHFAGGNMTDWGAHGLDILQWGLGMDESGPEEVWVEGDPYEKMVSTPENPGGRRGGPNKPTVYIKYPGGIIVEFTGANIFGAVFNGEGGQITVTRERAFSNPDELVRQPLENPAVEIYRGYQYARRTNHADNWLDCIRNGGTPVASAEVGQRTATICHLANIARYVSGITGETNQKLKWDAVNERFTNSDVANQFVRMPSRKGYEIPEVV